MFYDIYDEFEAAVSASRGTTLRSDTERRVFSNYSDDEKLESIKKTYSDPRISPVKLQNPSSEKVKNEKYFIRPYTPRN